MLLVDVLKGLGGAPQERPAARILWIRFNKMRGKQQCLPRFLLLDTTDFSRVVFQFPPKRAKQQRFLDTIDFSRVEVQFQPNFASSKKAETETPRD